MAKTKTASEKSFVAKPRKSCKRVAKSKTSKNKNSKNYVKAYRGQGKQSDNTYNHKKSTV